MSHRLDRLELEIHTASEPLARQLHDRLSGLHQRVLADLLGRVLDQFSPPGLLHRLESLELDLGEIPEEQLERLLPERLERALREALPAKLPNALVGDGLETPGAMAAPRALELLAAFAATGQLPWWAPRQNARLIPAALETALALPPHDLAAWWRQAVPQAAARQRLLAAADPEQAARLRELLGEALGDGLGGEALGEALWDGLGDGLGEAPRDGLGDGPGDGLGEALGDGPGDGLEMEEGETPLAAGPSADSEDLAESGAVTATPGRHLAGSRQADGEAQQGSLSAALMAQQGREDLATAAPDGANPPSAVLQPARASARDSASDSAGDTASVLELLAAYASTGQLPTAHPAKPDEPLGLDGAGLVMLSPFLETLFERLAWLTPERRFLGPEEQRRAVALLGFLVDGDANPPEWRLSLAKLLCGLELEALCSLDAPLNEAEQAEGEALLQATLAHGQGLLGDEIGPLREGILQRPALLSWRPGAWLLVVERREGDEALEELPWSWGWIRLPWMEAVLQVVW